MDSGSGTGNNGFWKLDWEQWILEVGLGTMDSGSEIGYNGFWKRD
jgi:hypothetical protein